MKQLFSCLFLVLLTAGFTCSEKSTRSDKALANTPNIILIVADDLGLYDLGCYGNEIIETPRIDALAAGGIRFTRAYCAAPICSPSRAAIQTGLHPVRIGMTEHLRGTPRPRDCQPLIAPKNAGRLAYAYRTIGEALQDQDYETIFVGKWHLGGQGYGPKNHGYDKSYAAGGQGLPRSFFRPFFNGNPYPELDTIAGDDDFLTDAIATLAVNALPTNGEPFFMDVNFYSPHVPIAGPPDLVAKYEAIIGDDPDALPRPHYAAMVERIDQQVGRIVDTLSARGMMENTIILFTSDHGALTVKEVPGFDAHTPPTDSGPLRGGKGYIYEGGLRVPLIAFGLDRFEPMVDDYPNVNTDYFSTFTALAGSEERSVDGEPIPSLTGAPETDRALYWHFPHYSPQRGLPAAAIIDKGDKYIEWYSDVDSTYFFQLNDDPGETMADTGITSSRIDELREKLTAWRDSLGARFMTVNPDFDGSDCE
ncbi:sulfatase [Neolewinella persica]|uniref:sulfatase n=1 Tax=Neolewinella persica TaxID=70998 RepID=UPI00037CCF16|nr:sulfatase [Neolewinella persica]